MKILSKAVKFKNNISSIDNESSGLSSIPSGKAAKIETPQSSDLVSVSQNNSALDHRSGTIAQWSPAMQTLLEEPPSNLPLQLIVGGIVFCLSFGVWAWFGEVEKIGKASGKLVPKGETYKIESLESAKISHIAVIEGEEIKAGQLIAKLNSESEAREVKRFQEMLAANQVELTQKLNLLEKVKIEDQTQDLIAQSDINTQKLAIESAIAKVEVTSQLLAQQKLERTAYLARQGRTDELSELDRAKLAQINSELKDHQKRLARLKPLADEGAISQEFIFQAQQAERQSQQQLIDSKVHGIGNISEQIFQSAQSMREMNASITKNQGELKLARKESERLQAELEQKIAENKKIKNITQQKVQQLELEISQATTKIAETRNLLETAQNKLDKRQLKSPVTGTVLSLNLDNIGKVVQSGETVAEIAPNNSNLLLSALLPDRDAGFVEKGMTAQVKFDAYSYQDYGVVSGKVISISANTINDENLGAVYQVKIELERNYITDDLKKILFKPGQTASADIVIRRLRIIDVLLDPIKKLQKDGIDL